MEMEEERAVLKKNHPDGKGKFSFALLIIKKCHPLQDGILNFTLFLVFFT